MLLNANNNFWAADRCEEAGCKSIFEIAPNGRTVKNFGADLFIEPHQIAVDHDGNVWLTESVPPGSRVVQTDLKPRLLAPHEQLQEV